MSYKRSWNHVSFLPGLTRNHRASWSSWTERRQGWSHDWNLQRFIQSKACSLWRSNQPHLKAQTCIQLKWCKSLSVRTTVRLKGCDFLIPCMSLLSRPTVRQWPWTSSNPPTAAEKSGFVSTFKMQKSFSLISWSIPMNVGMNQGFHMLTSSHLYFVVTDLHTGTVFWNDGNLPQFTIRTANVVFYVCACQHPLLRYLLYLYFRVIQVNQDNLVPRARPESQV